MADHGRKWLELTGHGYKCLEIAEMAENALNGWKLQEWVDCMEEAGMAFNCWKLIEIASYFRKLVEIAWNGWK